MSALARAIAIREARRAAALELEISSPEASELRRDLPSSALSSSSSPASLPSAMGRKAHALAEARRASIAEVRGGRSVDYPSTPATAVIRILKVIRNSYEADRAVPI